MNIASDVIGAATGGIWKLAAIALLATGGGLGFEWWSAVHDRDRAVADLAAERTRADDLQVGIQEQNRAVAALAEAKRLSDARGAAAQQLAAANGRRFDGALQKLAGARATTCDEAMPAVNQLLESVR